MSQTARFYFLGSLNDFLPRPKKHQDVVYHFTGTPAVKDAIEAIGVPHPEVDVVLANEKPVGWNYLLQAHDVVAVYPANAAYSWPPGYSLQASLPVWDAFILDVHLGKLAKSLRLLGIDTWYQNDYDDKTIVELAVTRNRAILTRDVGLLKHKAVQRGYWLRSQHTEEQLTEVLAYFKLLPKHKPFTRCLVCNGILAMVPKEQVREQLPPKTKLYFQEFYQCQSCRRIYWKGSHFERMVNWLHNLNLP